MEHNKTHERVALIDFGIAYTKVGMTGSIMPFAVVPTDIPFIIQLRETRIVKPTTTVDIIKSQQTPISMQIDEFFHKIIY